MKLLYKLIAFGTFGSIYITMIITFLTAYLEPTKSTLVTINTYGEANVELVVLVLTAPAIYSCFKTLLFEWVGS